MKVSRCDICGTDGEVTNLANIYTMGSEGTDACDNCHMLISKYAQTLRSTCNRIRLETRKKLKREAA
jgi:hypothetical protein